MLSLVWFVTDTVHRASGTRVQVPLSTGTQKQQLQQQQSYQKVAAKPQQEKQQKDVVVDIQQETEAIQQKEAEARQQIELEAQRQKEKEAQQQKEIEIKQQKEAEAEAQRQKEVEAEFQRQAEAEAKLQKEAEEKLKLEAEAEAERQKAAEAEEERKREAEAEAKLQKEAEEKLKLEAEAEAERQKAAEAEEERKREEEAEAQRQKEKEAEEKRQKEEEEQRQKEEEEQRQKDEEAERQRKEEEEKVADESAASSPPSDSESSVKTSSKIVTLTPSISQGNMSEAWAQEQVKKFSFNFDEADVDKNGSLSFGEVHNVIKNSGFRGSEEEAKFIFGHLDRDNDQKISKYEFTAAMNNLPRVNLKVFVLRKAFLALDKDGSGFLSRKEIMDATSRDCGLDVAAEKISDLLIYLIKEDDDQKVSFEEFLHVFGIEHVGSTMKSIFAKLDKDNSGFLTREELLAATKKEHELSMYKKKISDLLITWLKDTPSNKVNYQEFVQVWMKQKDVK